MRKLSRLIIVLGLAACSSPKMVYYFDHYEYKSARKNPAKSTPTEAVAEAEALEAPPIESIVATSQKDAITEPVASAPVKPVLTKEEVLESYTSLSRGERKEFKRELKREIKKMKKAPTSSANSVGGDLGLAAIFGICGIVVLIVAGGGVVLTVYGSIAVLVGLILFIKWINNR